MVNISCTFFILTLFLSTSSVVSLDIHDLGDVTLYIIREHLKIATSTISVAEHSSSQEFVYDNTNILNHLLQNLNDSISVQINSVEYTWDYYIFIIDSFDAFKFLLNQISISFKDRLLHFLIILTNHSPQWQKTIEDIFIDCYKLNVMNVNIMVKQSNGLINMYTYLLFLENRCRVVTPVVYFSFNRDLKELKKIFPEKMNNFYNCSLKVTARNERPFFIFIGNLSNPKPVGKWENLNGFEGILLKHLSYNLNFSIELLPFVNETKYKDGEIVYGSYLKHVRQMRCDNRSSRSSRFMILSNFISFISLFFACLFIKLLNHEADIAVGSFSGSDPGRTLISQSHIYYRSPIKHIVRGKILSTLSRIGLPLNIHLWLFLATFFFSASSMILSLKFVRPSIRNFILGKKNKTAILNLMAYLVGSPVPAIPQRNFARFLLMMLLLMDLVLRTVYLGSLYEVIRLNKTLAKPPLNFDELLSKNYIYLLPPDVSHLKLHPKNRIIIVAGNFEKRLEKLANFDGNYATLVLQPNFVSYSHQEAQNIHNNNELLMMDEVFLMYQIAMGFTKRSIFLNIFNKKLEEFSYCGILGKLSNELNYANHRFNKALKAKNLILTMKHLEAFFNVLFYLNLMATGVFILEVLSGRFRRIKQVLDWIND